MKESQKDPYLVVWQRVATSSKLLLNMLTMYWYVTRNVVTVNDPARTRGTLRVVNIIEV